MTDISSLSCEIEKLDYDINEKIKWVNNDVLAADENCIFVCNGIKNILMLMSKEIENLNKKVVELENENKNKERI